MADRPVRTCIGCRRRAPADELLRLHLDQGARLHLGRTGPGRGAWICAADPVVCLEAAVRRRAVDRALRRAVDRDSIEAVLARLRDRDREGPVSWP